MSDKGAKMEAVMAAADALRHARHLLVRLGATLHGSFVPPPPKSPMAKVLAEIAAAEEKCTAAALAHIEINQEGGTNANG